MSRPLVVGSRSELDAVLGTRPRVLVPTMGALHEGHASLVRHARALADDLADDRADDRGESAGQAAVVVSVFVNPLQFAAGEDLDRYPRTFEADLALAGREGAEVVLAPEVGEVYPDGDPQVTVDPGPLGTELEGAARPTHFRGVLTVVAKLFGLVGPEAAVLGEKDYQQLVLVRRMVADLCLGVRVEGGPTVRESDGLALSSRNVYLSPSQRQEAVVLSRALLAAQASGQVEAARTLLDDAPGIDLDYLELRDPDLGPAPGSGPARLLVAARVGATRLLDNVAIELGVPS